MQSKGGEQTWHCVHSPVPSWRKVSAWHWHFVMEVPSPAGTVERSGHANIEPRSPEPWCSVVLPSGTEGHQWSLRQGAQAKLPTSWVPGTHTQSSASKACGALVVFSGQALGSSPPGQKKPTGHTVAAVPFGP